MLSAPDWLRLLVCRGMAPTMPSGLRKLHLKIRIQSLSGNILKSDLTVTGLDELLKAVLRSVGGDAVMTAEEHKDMIKRCHRLLGNDNAAAADERPMYERLKAAEAEAAAEYNRKPPAPKPTDYPPQNVVPGPVWEAYAPFDREKRSLNAMRRMFERLAESVCMDPPPECPIGLEPIPPEHVALFPCCTNVFDKRNKEYLGRTPAPCAARRSTPAARRGQRHRRAPTGNRPSAPRPRPRTPTPTPTPTTLEDNEDALIRTLKDKAASEKHSGSIKAVVSTIKTFLAYRPKGARILLAFACDGDERRATTRTRRTLQQELPKMDTVESVGYNKDYLGALLVVENDTNRILIINTNNTSLSLEGLDLWNAQLIIMDKLNPGYLTPANMVQAIGRIMRPQFEVYIPGSGGGGARRAPQRRQVGRVRGQVDRLPGARLRAAAGARAAAECGRAGRRAGPAEWRRGVGGAPDDAGRRPRRRSGRTRPRSGSRTWTRTITARAAAWRARARGACRVFAPHNGIQLARHPPAPVAAPKARARGDWRACGGARTTPFGATSSSASTVTSRGSSRARRTARAGANPERRRLRYARQSPRLGARRPSAPRVGLCAAARADRAELVQALIAAPLLVVQHSQRRGPVRRVRAALRALDGWRVRDFMSARSTPSAVCAAKAGADGRLWEGQLAFQGALHVCNGSSPGRSALFASGVH